MQTTETNVRVSAVAQRKRSRLTFSLPRLSRTHGYLRRLQPIQDRRRRLFSPADVSHFSGSYFHSDAIILQANEAPAQFHQSK